MRAVEPNLDSLRLRADIQVAQKKWDDAVVTLNKAIALAANDGGLHGELGRIYLQKGISRERRKS